MSDRNGIASDEAKQEPLLTGQSVFKGPYGVWKNILRPLFRYLDTGGGRQGGDS